jgi:hypothetical protein
MSFQYELELSLNKSNHSEASLEDDDTVPWQYSMSSVNTDPGELLGSSQNTFNMSLDLDRHVTERLRFNDSDLFGESFAVDETPVTLTQKRAQHNLVPVLDEENSQSGNEDESYNDNDKYDGDDEADGKGSSPQQLRIHEAPRLG